MGYNIDFAGHFSIDPPLPPEHVRVLREVTSEKIIVPGSLDGWCHWVPSDDGCSLEWDGGECFRQFDTWLCYIIGAYFIPWGRRIDGYVRWAGDELDDVGVIKVSNNVVTMHPRIREMFEGLEEAEW